MEWASYTFDHAFDVDMQADVSLQLCIMESDRFTILRITCVHLFEVINLL